MTSKFLHSSVGVFSEGGNSLHVRRCTWKLDGQFFSEFFLWVGEGGVCGF